MFKKIDYTIQNFKNTEKTFRCPICKEKLFLEKKSLKCLNKHCFDISKKGYLTLNKHNKHRNEKVYDSILFDNRTKFINGNFYNNLHEIISTIINKKNNAKYIVDMGCGDGTHDNKILDLLTDKDTYLFGVDISKEGIVYSSNYVDKKIIPIVADLNDLPFVDNSIDVILNILSPSNENEMRRILKEDGIIIKVTPKKEYLKELRTILQIKEYENEEIIDENIKKNYIVKEKYQILETYDLNREDFLHLVKMTPLTKNYEIDLNINCITIALNVYVLKIKE